MPFKLGNRLGHKRRGKSHPRWKGGRKIDTFGYVLIYNPDHPNCNNHGYVSEHRLVMEKILKRYLTKSEVVHHINRNKQDNRPENLRLFTSHSEHKISENIGNFKDMSDRLCIKCESTRTYIRAGRPRWHRSNGSWICFKCYCRELRQKRLNKTTN